MQKVAAYFRMLRIQDWIKFYTIFPVLGALLARGFSPNLPMVCTIFLCVIGYGFVINNYFDVDIDRKHQKKAELGTNPLAVDHVTKKGTLLFSVMLLGLPLVLASMMNTVGLVFTLLSIISLTLYSASPIRLKDRFIIDIISHGVMFGGFPFLAGFALAGGDPLPSLQLPVGIASLCTIICCEALIAHQINDYWEDLGTASTTVLRIGRKKGWILLNTTTLISLLDLYLITHFFAIEATIYVGVFLFLLGYPFYSCRGEVMCEMRGAYQKVLVAGLQLQK